MAVDQGVIDYIDGILCPVAFDHHVFTAWGDKCQSRAHTVAMAGFAHIQPAQPVQAFGKHGGKFLGHVLHDNHARSVATEGSQHGFEGLCAAGGCAHGNESVGGAPQVGMSPCGQNHIGRVTWGVHFISFLGYVAYKHGL